jgi:leader peptidase (prepilin peptidase) / N-methyltransferase
MILWPELIIIFLLGATVGSFLNVIIYRLPIMLQKSWHADAAELLGHKISPPSSNFKLFNLALPGSHCPHCKQKLSIWHNIPILSFILLKGKCAFCQKKIAIRYFYVELISAILSALLALHFSMSWTLLASLIFTWLLICITFIDIEHLLIPDSLNYLLLWLGLTASVLHIFPFSQPNSAIIGAIGGYLFLFLVANLFELLAKKPGMGHGDFKLLAALGAWTGWQMLLFIILFSSIFALTYAIGNVLQRKPNSRTPAHRLPLQHKGTIVPFGPFLAIAGLIALLFHEPILYFYWHVAV